jgi:hypothetical protein
VISLLINGMWRDVDMPLLWVLRDSSRHAGRGRGSAWLDLEVIRYGVSSRWDNSGTVRA